MTQKRKNNDIRLSVIGDLDGMTVGALRQLLEGVSDDTKIEVDEKEHYEGAFVIHTVTFYDLVIRKD